MATDVAAGFITKSCHLSPLQAARNLFGCQGRVFLHSGANPDSDGRYSFLSANPHTELVANSSGVFAKGKYEFELGPGGFFEGVDRLLKQFNPIEDSFGPVPKLIGYLGYPLSGTAALEGSSSFRPRSSAVMPDAWFGAYDAVYKFDHKTRQGVILGEAAAVNALKTRIEENTNKAPAPVIGALSGSLKADDAYRRSFKKVQDYILAGDVYQVNLSRELRAPVEQVGDGLAIYENAFEHNPAAFGALLEIGGEFFAGQATVLSSSPERFLFRQRAGERLETRPIKGTRSRSSDEFENRRLCGEMLASEKERAEHLMIVDLERNDLGRIAKNGSVSVDSFARVIELPNLFHMVSTVSCQPKENVSVGQLLANTFPSGSITGAPKRRAMEVIDEEENRSRGVYTGSIGYVGANGELDFSVAIRTATLTSGELRMAVGGAVVADSTFEREYTETEEKARGWLRALGQSSSPKVTASGRAEALLRDLQKR